MSKKKHIILDRDGTVIKECHYLSDPNQVELLPNAIKGLKLLAENAFGLVLVTNQSGVGRGYYDLARLAQIHHRLEGLLSQENIAFDGIYFCPHTPADECDCRKPQTGMLTQASFDLDILLSESYMVGDKLCDIEVGQRVGATTYLVRTGYGSEVEKSLHSNNILPAYIVDDLYQLAQHIIENNKHIK